MVGYAGLLSGLSDLDFITAVLATSPGGMSEMAATSQTLQYDVALVVAFQVVRAVMVNSMATVYWTILSRSGFLTLVERVVGRPPGGPPAMQENRHRRVGKGAVTAPCPRGNNMSGTRGHGFAFATLQRFSGSACSAP